MILAYVLVERMKATRNAQKIQVGKFELNRTTYKTGVGVLMTELAHYLGAKLRSSYRNGEPLGSVVLYFFYNLSMSTERRDELYALLFSL